MPRIAQRHIQNSWLRPCSSRSEVELEWRELLHQLLFLIDSYCGLKLALRVRHLTLEQLVDSINLTLGPNHGERLAGHRICSQIGDLNVRVLHFSVNSELHSTAHPVVIPSWRRPCPLRLGFASQWLYPDNVLVGSSLRRAEHKIQLLGASPRDAALSVVHLEGFRCRVPVDASVCSHGLHCIIHRQIGRVHDIHTPRNLRESLYRSTIHCGWIHADRRLPPVADQADTANSLLLDCLLLPRQFEQARDMLIFVL
mmetsp:Transcript_39066/g.87682  ORF Transcript_39066/g.87682 Transcript_39066/m.87682 type:complete len:255 (+) Transcript_39066:2123-2887(+)